MRIYSAPKLLDKSGNATVSRLDTNRISDSVSGMAGIRGNFDTGFVSHKGNVGPSVSLSSQPWVRVRPLVSGSLYFPPKPLKLVLSGISTPVL